MDNLKPALTKLLNTLGNRMTDEYYGMTFDFTIGDIKVMGNSDIIEINVITNPQIPSTLFVEDSPWNHGKFSTGNYLSWNLEYLTKYLGLGSEKVFININNMIQSEDMPLGDKFDICSYEDDFYRLDSSATVLHIPSGYTYPINNDLCSIDASDGYHLSNIENDDWWDALTENEKYDLTKFYKL